MMRDDEILSRDGSGARLTDRVLGAVEREMDVDAGVEPSDIAEFEDLHVCGQEATFELAALSDIDEDTTVLDVSSGLGGAARTLATEFGCHVVGVDLTGEFCRAAEELTRLVDLDDRVSFRHTDPLDLPFDDDTFDVVFLQDLAADVEYKARLADELARVLRPSGRLAVHEVLAGSVEPLRAPMPLAENGAVGSLVQPETFVETMADAGFEADRWLDATVEAIEWYHSVVERVESTGDDGLPPGFEHVVREDFSSVCRTMWRNADEDRARVYYGVFKPQPAAV
ncbi:SAM-dependent methyltransferase [Haloarchaeobius sp. DFWS5]|uniref:SAM-dependent methyltransferase n=1 Tax=Haloarchaeobius sp. DFWS5 TaxID=3446114 RepID=UPI003EB82B6A